MSRPFRFIAPMPRLDQPAAAWRDAVRRLEAAGYATVAISDHVSRGWAIDPIVALMAAADATTTLRVLSLVLANDYRRPALVHRAIASVDVLSGGRVELGLGAGWLAEDYAALGIELDPPRVRVGRLAESVRLIKRLFESTDPLTFDGEHYAAQGLEGLPEPVQRPRPPILVGGGGRAVLSLAGVEADIAGVNASLARESGRSAGVGGMTEAAVERKIGWVRLAAAEAGRGAGEPELQVSVLETHLTDSPSEARARLDGLADDVGVARATVEASPAVLVGSVEHCADLLLERRERFGFSYIKLGPDADGAAPLVARLAGR